MGQKVRGANGAAQPHRRVQLAAIPTAPLTALIVPTGTWGLGGSCRVPLSAQRGSQELSWDLVCSRNASPWLAACTEVWMLSRDPVLAVPEESCSIPGHSLLERVTRRRGASGTVCLVFVDSSRLASAI